MRRPALAACLGVCLFLSTVSAPSAASAEPTGRWDREDGLGGIDIRRCGLALCGRIAWLRDTGTPAHIGQEVLVDMMPDDENTWSGSANNPEDGRTYKGTMTLTDSRLLTRGCILGGLICHSVSLTRPH